MRKFLTIVLTGLLIFVITGCQDKTDQAKTDQTVSTKCDRQCLEGFVDQYLTAMVAHDTSRAPFAENVRYTENAEEITFANISEGLWTKATGLGDYKRIRKRQRLEIGQSGAVIAMNTHFSLPRHGYVVPRLTAKDIHLLHDMTG